MKDKLYISLLRFVPTKIKRFTRFVINIIINNVYEYTKNDIDGEMSRRHLNWLFKNAKKMNSIVEVGSWKGRSTHALLSGCRGVVYAVDTFSYSPDGKDPYKLFLENVGHFKNLKIYKMNSVGASKKFDDKSVDMVFIDGNHSYESVLADIEAWLPKTKKLICGHDYDKKEYPGLVKAVNEKFKKVRNIGNIWFCYL